MNVSQDVAQNIVEEMKKIINQDINYFDINGIIIASTDRSRMGNYHGGAKKVIEKNSDLVIRYDKQYEGARKGINVPVYFENEIVGVIGITGEEEVVKYGQIIRRMTEILIKEAYLKEQENLDRESKRLFVEEILFRSNNDEKALMMRGDLLSIRTDIPRVVIVARFLDNDNKQALLAPSINEMIYNSFRNHINHDIQNLIVQSGTNIIMILKNTSTDIINRIINNIKNDIAKFHNFNIFFGVGDISNNSNEVKGSYIKAKKALDYAVAFNNDDVIYYKDMDIGLLIDDITKDTIRNYNEKIFNQMNTEQIQEYLKVLSSFIKHNGSITKTSEELFIHKNTLQYRLNKLRDITGYDPRVISDMVVLYLAFTLYKLKK